MKDLERLRRIYDKTDGCCHLCHCKLAFSNHGLHGTRGAWHVEHSTAKANGGTNHLNNLFPACITCNLEKGTLHTRTVRSRNGIYRAPLSKKRKVQIRSNNTASGVILGGTIGAVFGPGGILIGAFLGGVIGNRNSPKS